MVLRSGAVGPADLKHLSSVLCSLLTLGLLMHRIKHMCLFAKEVLPWFGLGGRQSSIGYTFFLVLFVSIIQVSVYLAEVVLPDYKVKKMRLSTLFG